MRLSALQVLARLLLAAALLAAWQAALEHPIEHVDEHGHLVHVSGANGGDARGENDHEGDPSDRLGEALAALAACAPTAALDCLAEFASTHEVPRPKSVALRAAEPPPFLSQGPPASV
jgi:hypothetical protein